MVSYDYDVESITYTTDRTEAHRIYENVQRLDAEVVASLGGELDSANVTLQNVYAESYMYEDVVRMADPQLPEVRS